MSASQTCFDETVARAGTTPKFNSQFSQAFTKGVQNESVIAIRAGLVPLANRA
jgi:hypothetical protein